MHEPGVRLVETWTVNYPVRKFHIWLTLHRLSPWALPAVGPVPALWRM